MWIQYFVARKDFEPCWRRSRGLRNLGTTAVNLTTKRILKCLKTAGRYGDGDGLYLQVNTPGRGSWLLRYERNGRERAMGLGMLSDFSLHEARQRAKAARQLLADGLDPIDAKKTQRQQQALEASEIC
jgi:hypothetical protein